MTEADSGTNVHEYDCFWCGAVAMDGPFTFEGYDSNVYLCELCRDNHSDKIERRPD